METKGGRDKVTPENIQQKLDAILLSRIECQKDENLRELPKYKDYVETIKTLYENRFSCPDNRYSARVEFLLYEVIKAAGFINKPWSELSAPQKTKVLTYFERPVIYLEIKMWEDAGIFKFNVLDSANPTQVFQLCGESNRQECYAHTREDYNYCTDHLDFTKEELMEKLKQAIHRIVKIAPEDWPGSAAMSILIEKLKSNVEFHFTPFHKLYLRMDQKGLLITSTQSRKRQFNRRQLCKNFEFCHELASRSGGQVWDACDKCNDQQVHVIAICKGEEDTMFVRSIRAPKKLSYNQIWKTLSVDNRRKRILSICHMELFTGNIIGVVQRRAVVALYLQFERMAREISDVSVRSSFLYIDGSTLFDEVVEYAKTRGLNILLEPASTFPKPIHYEFYDGVRKATNTIYEFSWGKWCYIGEKSGELNFNQPYAAIHSKDDSTVVGKKHRELWGNGDLDYGVLMPCETVANCILDKGATTYIVEATWQMARLIQSSQKFPEDSRLICGNLRFNLHDQCVIAMKTINWLPEINAILGKKLGKKLSFEYDQINNNFVIGSELKMPDWIILEAGKKEDDAADT